MKGKGAISLPLIADPEVSYLFVGFSFLKGSVCHSRALGCHSGQLVRPGTSLCSLPCPVSEHSSTALEHSSLPRPKMGLRRSCSPTSLMVWKGSAWRVETSSQVLSNLFLLCGGFTYINVFSACSFVSYLGFIMRLICLECSQTLSPGSHMSGQGLHGS